MAKKKSNTQLLIMLVLIIVIAAVIFFLPTEEKQATPTAPKTTEQAADTPVATDSTTLVKVGDTAPDFTVEMFDGSKITLSQLKGKAVLLNFWATWCPPCREELTHVQSDIIDRFADKPFVFLPISRGETKDEVAAFREKTKYTFPMGLDTSKAIFGLYATNSIPRNFLIDASGKVVFASIGYEPEEFKQLIQAIEKTLK